MPKCSSPHPGDRHLGRFVAAQARGVKSAPNPVDQEPLVDRPNGVPLPHQVPFGDHDDVAEGQLGIPDPVPLVEGGVPPAGPAVGPEVADPGLPAGQGRPTVSP